MPTNEIKIKMTGGDETGYLLLGDFTEQLDAIRGVLRRIDAQLSGGQEKAIYRLVGLSLASPPVARIRIDSTDDSIDYGCAIAERFFYGLDSIVKKKEYPVELGMPIITAYQDMGKKLQGGIATIEISGNGYSYEIEESYPDTLKEIIGENVIEIGSLTGKMLKLNLYGYGRKRRFYIYPQIGPQVVTCIFDKDLTDRVIDGVNRHVEVFGRLKYHLREKYPHEIDVSDIHIFPPLEKLPRLSDLKGMTSNASGGLTPEEYQRRLRDAWRRA